MAEEPPRQVKRPAVEDGDPVARLLISKGKWGLDWSPLNAAIGLCALWVMSYVIALAILVLDHNLPSAQDIFLSLAYTLILVFFFGHFYVWQVNKLNALFQELAANGALRGESDAICQMSGKYLRLFGDQIWWVLSLVISTLLSALTLVAFTHWDLTGRSTIIARVSYPATLLSYYIILIIILRNLVFVRSIKRSLNGSLDIEVAALHPDGCGGFGPIRSYIDGVIWLVIPVALGLTIYGSIFVRDVQGWADVRLWAPVGLYILVVPLSLFGPLWAAHGSMRDAKDRKLAPISSNYETELDRLLKDTKVDTNQLEARLIKLRNLRSFYDEAGNSPEWPYDFSGVKRFWAPFIVLLPIAVNIVSLVLKLLE